MGRHKMKKDGLVVVTEHYKNMLFFQGWVKTNLFNSWYELLGDVCSNGLVFKLQLGAMLRIKRLENSDDLPVLAGATCLFLMSEVKPKKINKNQINNSPFFF